MLKRMLIGLCAAVALVAGPATADDELYCEANCKEDTDECKTACVEHAPPEARGPCLNACEKVEIECVRECRELPE